MSKKEISVMEKHVLNVNVKRDSLESKLLYNLYKNPYYNNNILINVDIDYIKLSF